MVFLGGMISVFSGFMGFLGGFLIFDFFSLDFININVIKTHNSCFKSALKYS